MKTNIMTLITSALCVMVFSNTTSQSAVITPELRDVMAKAPDDELILVGIFLKAQRNFTAAERVSFNAMPKNSRQTFIAREVVSFARDQQKKLIQILDEAEKQKKCTRISQIEIVNAIGCRLTKDVIEAIAKQSEISLIIWDKELPVEDTGDEVIMISNPITPLRKTTTVEIGAGVEMINAPDVWDMGYTGDGVLVAIIDIEGFNYNHPDLADHLWDGSDYVYGGQSIDYHGWNFRDGTNNPYNPGGHGTRCAGIVAGDGTGNGSWQIQTGVAPDANLMFLWGVTEMQLLNCFDFFSDMKDAYGNNFRMPDVVSMSKSIKFKEKPAYELWRDNCRKLLEFGIVHINSAGNEGNDTTGGCTGNTANGYPIPYNVAAPANCPPPWLHPDQPAPVGDSLHVSSAIAVGYVDTTGQTIGYNSSRGPCAWEDILDTYSCQSNAYIDEDMWDYRYNTVPVEERNALIKPDIVGPGGENIHSTNWSTLHPELFYNPLNFTSAAAPHVAGTAALMLEANPNLEPEDVCRILQLSAIDLGDAGKDNVYGAGRVDAFQAVVYTLADENKTPIISSTLFNNQRILARGKNNSNVLYEVFFSGVGDNTETFFKKSTNSGVT